MIKFKIRQKGNGSVSNWQDEEHQDDQKYLCMRVCMCICPYANMHVCMTVWVAGSLKKRKILPGMALGCGRLVPNRLRSWTLVTQNRECWGQKVKCKLDPVCYWPAKNGMTKVHRLVCIDAVITGSNYLWAEGQIQCLNDPVSIDIALNQFDIDLITAHFWYTIS